VTRSIACAADVANTVVFIVASQTLVGILTCFQTVLCILVVLDTVFVFTVVFCIFLAFYIALNRDNMLHFRPGSELGIHYICKAGVINEYFG